MIENNQKRVVVAMSGGVDSSVAAHLLVEQGYEVIGISMRLWAYEQEATHGCCTPEDLYDARRVADRLSIPFYVNNFEKNFEENVIRDFVEGYAKGETPTPCVRCNQDVKFTTLLTRAKELGASSLATGHYARIDKTGNKVRLLRARDVRRDQSYFLFGMTQEQLVMLMFPLGEMTKEEVRDIAKKADLPVADKPDSQEICFVPDHYTKFVERHLPAGDRRAGNIVTEKGEVLAKHDGIHSYTVGQRKRLGIQSVEPHYVLKILPTGNVVVGNDKQLHKKSFSVRDVRWSQTVPKSGAAFDIKIRNRFDPARGRIDAIDGAHVDVSFDEPQRAITPGQAAVFYDGDEVIGGGWVSKSA